MEDHGQPQRAYFVSGGTLAPDAPSYVERQADLDLLSHLKEGETCYVLNSRQMGKSSLCVRTILRLKEAGARTAFLDLTKFGGRNLTAEQWYAALLSESGRELGLRGEFLAFWKENADLPPVQRLFGALVEVGLKEDSPVVVFIDEIDVTLSLPFSADEFFAAIRQCYVGRATDERLKRLSFCLLGTATPADLIQDTRVSPFNIGKRIELRDFTAEEAAPLATGLGDHALLQWVLHWTGGHPYLTQRLCQAVMESGSKDVDKVCSDLFLTHSAKEGDDNLAFVRNRLLKSEADLAALLDQYKKMRSGKSVQDDETNPLCALLKLSGVAKVEGGLLKVRNRIYEHVFDREWVETHMPDAEKRRQREAYRKGVLRTAGWAAGFVAIFAALVVFAFRSEANAKQKTALAEKANTELNTQKVRAEQLLYFANVNLAQAELKKNNFSRIRSLLADVSRSPFRGFEWYYLAKLAHPDSLLLRGHQSQIYAVDYSSDGSLVATGSRDGTAKIWDARSGQLRGSTKCDSAVRWIDFSKDGDTIALGLQDGTAHLIDVASGKKILEVAGHSDWITCIALSRDGRFIATASADRSARVWDATNGRLLRELKGPTDVVFGIAFSPDSRLIAAGCSDRIARVWEVTTGKLVKNLVGHEGAVFSVAFSPDGKSLATASEDKTAKIWDLSSSRRPATIRGHTDGVSSVDLSRDQKLLVTGSWDFSAKVWSVLDGTCTQTLVGHGDSVNAVFSPDSKSITTASWDGTARVWKVKSRERPALPKITSIYDAWLLLSPNGRYLAARTSRGFEVYNIETHTTVSIGGLNGVAPRVFAFRSDDQSLATVSGSEPIQIWDSETGRQLHSIALGRTGDPSSIEYSPDANLIAVGYRDGTVLVTNHDRTKVRSLSAHNGAVLDLRFAPDGKTLATGGEDHLVKLWDLSKKEPERTLSGHTDNIRHVVFSSDGNRLLTASDDATIRVWSLTEDSQPVLLKGSTGSFWEASFSGDGRRIVSSSEGHTLRIWDSGTGLETMSIDINASNVQFVDRDGTLLVVEITAEGLFIRKLIAASPAEVEKWEREEQQGASK